MNERDDEELPMARIAEVGGAFEWLHDEPELYSDADLIGQDERGLSAEKS